MVWITTLKSQTLSNVRVRDWTVQHAIPLPYGRAHDIVRVEEGVWVVHTADRVIVKLDCAEVAELDRIEISPRDPKPNGLSACGDDLLYCDAASG